MGDAPIGDGEAGSNRDASDKHRRWESVSPEMAEILRQKTGAERLEIAHGLWRMAYKFCTQSVMNQHPTWTEEQVRREVAWRMSGGEFPEHLRYPSLPNDTNNDVVN